MNVRDAVIRAAAIAAPVFETQIWTYGSKNRHIPSEAELALVIQGLVDSLEIDSASVETGRIKVSRDHDGDFRIWLELAAAAGEGS